MPSHGPGRPASQARLMEAHVLRAGAELADGRLARDVLARLWQAAFAAGVSASQAPPAQFLPDARGLAATAAGWRWGTPALLALKPGARFSYGGPDPGKPTCDRQAVISGWQSGRLVMELADTGESVSAPVMLWARDAC